MYALTPLELPKLDGLRLGPGPWHLMAQNRIDLFAEATDDHQWIHVDSDRAGQGPYGGTIAHGYLTLSLLPKLQRELWTYSGFELSLNYGLERVRFPAPLPTNSRFRLASANLSAVERPDASWLLTVESSIEVQESDRPACVAQTVVLLRP